MYQSCVFHLNASKNAWKKILLNSYLRQVKKNQYRIKMLPQGFYLKEIVVEVSVEGGRVDVEGLALPRQDGEHSAHHQQTVSIISFIIT